MEGIQQHRSDFRRRRTRRVMSRWPAANPPARRNASPVTDEVRRARGETAKKQPCMYLARHEQQHQELAGCSGPARPTEIQLSPALAELRQTLVEHSRRASLLAQSLERLEEQILELANDPAATQLLGGTIPLVQKVDALRKGIVTGELLKVSQLISELERPPVQPRVSQQVAVLVPDGSGKKYGMLHNGNTGDQADA
jgi:hypothetical protein